MAGVPSPQVSTKTAIPDALWQDWRKRADEGVGLSAPQAEAICLAQAAHEKHLPAEGEERRFRQGVLSGDGTGVGKGRIVAGVFLNCWLQGRKKGVWITQNWNLVEDAKAEWAALGQNPDQIYSLRDLTDNAADKIALKEGIVVLTYGTLRSEKQVGERTRTRPEQLVEWLGTSWDGVLAFDECHNMGNLRGKQPSQQAVAGCWLQDALPEARVMYVSATAATESWNLAYMSRLGLWGRGTPFHDADHFVNSIEAGGLAAMEVVARDLKAQGLFCARQLAFDDGTPEGRVEYETVEHIVTPEQHELYDEFADAWHGVLGGFTEAAELTGQANAPRTTPWSRIFNLQQMFFHQVLTSFMLPTLIERMKAALAAGDAVVVQLTSTNEAEQERQLARISDDPDATLDDFSISPMPMLINLVEETFPTQQYVARLDPHTGRMVWVPLFDSAGKPVHNPGALAMKEALLTKLASVKAAPPALDELIDEFGPDAVAEVTGRKRRVQKDSNTGQKVTHVRGEVRKANAEEARAFMDDRKRILIFSQAGGIGRSYHADKREKNQRRRQHFVLQAGWRADLCLQGLGRTHRSFQAWAPHYVLMTTDLKGHKRFITSIARRLDQSGAVTKGQREAGSTGLFTPADNLESHEAEMALRQFFVDLHHGQAPFASDSIDTFEDITRLFLRTIDGDLLRETPDVRHFLNRLMLFKVDEQNEVFDQFFRRVEAVTKWAIETGNLDQGLETLRADRIERLSEAVVQIDPRSGAETKYVRVLTYRRTQPLTWEMLIRQESERLLGFVENTENGRIYAYEKGPDVHDRRSGAMISQYRLIDPVGEHYVPQSNIENYAKRWKKHSRESALPLWEQAVKNAPQWKTREEHLITGALLPVWDRLIGRTRVLRLKLDDGEVILGRQIAPKDLAHTLGNLGIAQDIPKRTAAEWHALLLDGTVRVTLANGWELRRRMTAGEPRIVIDGPDHRDVGPLQRDGCIVERIGYVTRAFIPAGDAGIPVLERLLKYKPIAKVEHDAGPTDGYSTMQQTAQRAGAGPTATPTNIKLHEGGKGAPISAHSVILQIDYDLHGLGATVRGGHVRRAGVLGWYNWLWELVRTRRGFEQDIGLHVHEGAHHLDNKYKVWQHAPRDAKVELKRLDYRPKAARAIEGWAEFLRYYVTDDELADTESRAPEFYRYFVHDWLPKHPDVQKLVNRWRNLTQQYKYGGAVARAQASLVRGGKGPKLPERRFWEDVRSALWNAWVRFYSSQKALEYLGHVFEREARRRGYRPLTGNSMMELYSALMWTGRHHAARALEEGIFSMVEPSRKLGPSINDVFDELGERTNEALALFEVFVWARHARESWARGKDPGITKEDAERVYTELRTPERERAAATLTAFNNALLDMISEPGVEAISKAEATAMKAYYQTYVPLHRLVKKGGPGRGEFRREWVSQTPAVKRRFGSQFPVISPIEATVFQCIQRYERACKQIVINEMVRAAAPTQVGQVTRGEAARGMGGWITPIPPGLKVIKFTWEEVQEQLVRQGMHPDDIPVVHPETLLFLYRPDYTIAGGRPIVRVYENGKPQLYEIDPGLYRTIEGMDIYRLPFFLDLTIGNLTRLLRLGATGLTLNFALKNPIRDYQMYLAQKEHAKGVRGAVAPMEMMAAYLVTRLAEHIGKKGDPYVRLWTEMGGAMSTRLGLDWKVMREKVLNVMKDNVKRRTYKVVSHPVQAIRELLSAGEVGARLAEFRAVLIANGYGPAELKAGKVPPRRVLVQAINAAHRVTIDFRRMGYMGRWLNQLIPFWNAPLEGLDRVVRLAMERPGRFVMVVASIAASTFAYWWEKKDEEWYVEGRPWLKSGFWTFTDTDGKPVVRIPRQQEYGIIAAGVEALCDYFYRRDPSVFKDYAEYALQTALPSPSVAGVTPILETYFNWSFFRGRPIVGESVAGRLPETQYYEYNTELSKAICAQLAEWGCHVSPAKMEHLVDSVTGGLYRGITRPVEAAFGARKLQLEDYPGLAPFALRRDYSRSVDEFYDQAEQIGRQYQTAQHEGTAAPELRRQNALLSEVRRTLSQLDDLIEGVSERESRFEIERLKIGLARAALARDPLARYPSLYAALELPPDAAAIRDKLLGNHLYAVTSPPPEREKEESEEHLRDRQQHHAEAREITQAFFGRFGIPKERAEELLGQAARRRGVKTTGIKTTSAYFQRLTQLRELLRAAGD